VCGLENKKRRCLVIVKKLFFCTPTLFFVADILVFFSSCFCFLPLLICCFSTAFFKKDIPFLLNFQKTNKSVEKMLRKNIENKKQF